MPVVAADLIAPVGEVEPSLFAASDPGGSTTQRATSAIAEVAGASDAAVKAWVYHRLYSAKAQKLAAQPASMSVDGESQSWHEYQIEHFRTLAAQKLANYQLLTAPATVVTAPRSKSVRGKAVW